MVGLADGDSAIRIGGGVVVGVAGLAGAHGAGARGKITHRAAGDGADAGALAAEGDG